jgi:hypothetical protein
VVNHNHDGTERTKSAPIVPTYRATHVATQKTITRTFTAVKTYKSATSATLSIPPQVLDIGSGILKGEKLRNMLDLRFSKR